VRCIDPVVDRTRAFHTEASGFHLFDIWKWNTRQENRDGNILHARLGHVDHRACLNNNRNGVQRRTSQRRSSEAGYRIFHGSPLKCRSAAGLGLIDFYDVMSRTYFIQLKSSSTDADNDQPSNS
jgi:hypothetical protein